MNHLIMRIRHWKAYVIRAVWQQIRARYVDTLLGPLWVLLLPVVLILIYTTIFSKVLHAKLAISDQPLAYSIFLCAGLIPWLYFSDLINRMTNLYTANAHLLRKAAIPWQALTVIAWAVSFFDFLVFLFVYLVFLVWINHLPTLALWGEWLLLTALLTLLALTIGLFLAVLQVFFRDTAHFVSIALQLGFWLTPIVYPLQVVPAWGQGLIELNPLTGVVQGYQKLFLNHAAVDWSLLLASALLALIGGALAWHILRRRGRELVDVL